MSNTKSTKTEQAPVRIRLVLDVAYNLNGEAADAMIQRLQDMCMYAIGNGMLTGESEAEVENYSINAKRLPEPLDEDVLAGFMLERIENGALGVEEIPLRLARYGLMEPEDFIDEMRERMES